MGPVQPKKGFGQCQSQQVSQRVSAISISAWILLSFLSCTQVIPEDEKKHGSDEKKNCDDQNNDQKAKKGKKKPRKRTKTEAPTKVMHCK